MRILILLQFAPYVLGKVSDLFHSIPVLGQLDRLEQVTNVQLFSISAASAPTTPTLSLSRVSSIKSAITATSPSGNSYFLLQFSAFQREFSLLLEGNNRLLHPDLELSGIDVGAVLSEHSFFHGKLLSPVHLESLYHYGLESPVFDAESDGWCRLSLNDDHGLEFQGIIFDGKDLYTVKPAHQYNLIKLQGDPEAEHDLVIYRERDRIDSSESGKNHDPSTGSFVGTCGHDDLIFNSEMIAEFQRQQASQGLLRKRDSSCSSTKKTMYMGVAADCNYIRLYGGVENAFRQILSNWNQASGLYETTFGISLSIISVFLEDDCGTYAWNQPCSETYPLAYRLSDFSAWRGTQNSQAGLWHLMSTCSSGTVIGISWSGMACQTAVRQQKSIDALGASGFVSGTAVSTSSPNEWLTVAHEIGHNFGAMHDCTGANPCPNVKTCCPCSNCDCTTTYIMNPTSDSKNQLFSPCSIDTICNRLSNFTCLKSYSSTPTISLNMCGNGIKEEGEECDCGSPFGAACLKSQCCDGNTCKLKPGARCEDLNDMCCNSCQIKKGGSLCRASVAECDPAEYCTGSTSDCPEDTHLPNLTPCTIKTNTSLANTQGQCALGTCTSRDYQCILKGATFDIAKECPGYGNQCSLFCMGSNPFNCTQISGSYQDGTLCSFQGTCRKGVCNSTANDLALGWMNAHAGTMIGLSMALLFCIGYTSRAYKKFQSRKKESKSATTMTRYPSSLFLETTQQFKRKDHSRPTKSGYRRLSTNEEQSNNNKETNGVLSTSSEPPQSPRKRISKYPK